MTDAQQPPAQAGHDPAMPYQDEVVPGSMIDIERWDWWSHTDAGIVHYYTKGPCPACRAETQGHFPDIPAPIEGQDRGQAPPAPAQPARHEVEIPLRCLCGTDHGHPGAAGCGRQWSIIGPRSSP
jgi:hypothetical protein